MIFYLFFGVVFAISLLCAWGMSVADFRRRIIPDAYLCPLFLCGLITVAFFPHWVVSMSSAVVGAVLGYALGAGVGIVFERITKDKKAPAPIGMGDIKLLATGGIWLGTNGLAVALVVACITGGIWAKYKHVRFIPFAPFFVFGAILALIISVFLV